jgi:catechol 2,3-dioxygenase-like lactoylglutathione lyase family enzyme
VGWEFEAEVFQWRGPAPYFFVATSTHVNDFLCAHHGELTYGWGVIPAQVRIGATEVTTSLMTGAARPWLWRPAQVRWSWGDVERVDVGGVFGCDGSAFEFQGRCEFVGVGQPFFGEYGVALDLLDEMMFWLRSGMVEGRAAHIGFVAENTAQVDATYNAAIAAGATNNGAPGARLHYNPRYYAGNVLDPDGYSLEFVYKSWQH